VRLVIRDVVRDPARRPPSSGRHGEELIAPDLAFACRAPHTATRPLFLFHRPIRTGASQGKTPLEEEGQAIRGRAAPGLAPATTRSAAGDPQDAGVAGATSSTFIPQSWVADPRFDRTNKAESTRCAVVPTALSREPTAGAARAAPDDEQLEIDVHARTSARADRTTALGHDSPSAYHPTLWHAADSPFLRGGRPAGCFHQRSAGPIFRTAMGPLPEDERRPRSTRSDRDDFCLLH